MMGQFFIKIPTNGYLLPGMLLLFLQGVNIMGCIKPLVHPDSRCN